MATVTGLTAPRMLEIEAASIVDGEVDAAGHLKLITRDGTIIDAGLVKGPPGEEGPPGADADSLIFQEALESSEIMNIMGAW